MRKQGLASLYTELTSVSDKSLFPQTQETQEENAARFQARQNWLGHSITEEIRNEMEERVIELFKETLTFARNSPVITDKIVSNLNQINAIIDIQRMFENKGNI